jgi:parvulin-like peptidyl-prolyl isomerase
MPSARPFASAILIMLAALNSPGAAQPAPPAGAGERVAVFARVGETQISATEFQRALAVAMRKKYYHAKPPEAELAKFQREVGDEVVNRVLLLAEARRRGVQPDRARIDATVAGYDAQYKGSANWSANREKMLAAVVPQLESESLLERLDKIVRTTPDPTEAELRAYYERHRDRFVEPEQVKLSVILLKVDPSSRQAVWNGAHEEGRRLHKRLQGGADFAELAQSHSGDRSASQGGQMDYTHRGMLPETVHEVVDKLKPGQLSEPVQMLEGVAILRLDDRRPARQRAFDQARERAAELWRRDEGQARWTRLVADLRRGVRIQVDESHYTPMPATPAAPRGG